MAIVADLVIPQGTDWTGPTWALLGPDGLGIALTGWTLKAQVRATITGPDVLHEWSTSLGNVEISEVIVTVTQGGVSTAIETAGVALTVAHDVSEVWMWRGGVYDVELVLDDVVYRIITESKIRVSPEVTK